MSRHHSTDVIVVSRKWKSIEVLQNPPYLLCIFHKCVISNKIKSFFKTCSDFVWKINVDKYLMIINFSYIILFVSALQVNWNNYPSWRPRCSRNHSSPTRMEQYLEKSLCGKFWVYIDNIFPRKVLIIL